MDSHDLFALQQVLFYLHKTISVAGIFIIFIGILLSLFQYTYQYLFTGHLILQSKKMNTIRLTLNRSVVLGLEFSVAASLISATATPQYDTLVIAASMVLIRTVLVFTLNRESWSAHQSLR